MECEGGKGHNEVALVSISANSTWVSSQNQTLPFSLLSLLLSVSLSRRQAELATLSAYANTMDYFDGVKGI